MKTESNRIISYILGFVFSLLMFLLVFYIFPSLSYKKHKKFYLFKGEFEIERIDIQFSQVKIIASDKEEYYFQSHDKVGIGKLLKGQILRKNDFNEFVILDNLLNEKFRILILDANSSNPDRKYYNSDSLDIKF